MQANYKNKNIVYDIETNSYSDGFTTSFDRELAVADTIYIRTHKDFITPYCKQVEKEWSKNVRYYTDFVMQLNHRAGYHYNKNSNLCKLYCSLYEKYNDLAYKLFKGEDLQYYIGILD